LQLRIKRDDPKARVMSMIRQVANKVKSKSFSKFTEQLESRLGGPFDDINGMIQKMIFRLQAEQKDEDSHKAWCDKELQNSDATKTAKEEKIDELNNKLDELISRLEGSVQPNIEELNDKIAKLKEHVQKITEQREEEKHENKVALKDSLDAQKAMVAAVKEIEKAYGTKSNVFGLVQQKHKAPTDLPENPETWDSSYTGTQDPSSSDGILTLMETVLADFEKMEAEIKAQEEAETTAFNDEMKSCQEDIAHKTATLEANQEEETQLKKDSTAHQKFLKSTRKELNTVKKYIDELQPACVDGDSSYDDRKQARKDEIDALEEAMDTLKKAFEKKDK